MFEMFRRYYYVTPTIYLEHLNCFLNLNVSLESKMR
jgi:hypothetical protein